MLGRTKIKITHAAFVSVKIIDGVARPRGFSGRVPVCASQPTIVSVSVYHRIIVFILLAKVSSFE